MFIKWFQNRVADQLTTKSNSISENLRWLAHGPRTNVLSYCVYLTNGYHFYTIVYDDWCTVQNSGMTLVAQSMHIFSTKNNKPIFVNMSYYGVIDDIWELDYAMFCVPVFRYKWVENNNNIKVDELGLIPVDLNKDGWQRGHIHINITNKLNILHHRSCW